MWIIARLVIAFGSLVYKLFYRSASPYSNRMHGSMRYMMGERTHKGKVTQRYVETPVDSAFMCRLSKETKKDRFFKSLGFGAEMQTRDERFDEAIYVIADHPLAHVYLTSSNEVRAIIQRVILNKATSISITGTSLRFNLWTIAEVSSVLDDLQTLAAELKAVQQRVRSHFADPYYNKALIIQALVCSILAYGVVGIFEGYLVKEDYYLNRLDLWPLALIISGGLMFAAIAMVWIFLRGSSLAPRLMAENLVFSLLLPFSGYQIASDINRGYDTFPGWVASCDVEEFRQERHYRMGGRRRRSTYYTYHIRISPNCTPHNAPFTLPTWITIPLPLYNELQQTKHFGADIGAGAFGIPWYRRMYSDKA